MGSEARTKITHNNTLETSQKNLQNLFNSMEDFVFVLDFESRIISVNSIVLKRLKYSKEELIGNSALVVHPPDQREAAAAILGEMVNGDRDICPIPLFTKDGVLIPVETKVTKGTWGNIDALFGISRDITDRQKYEDLLKISEEKYRELYENAPTAFFSVGTDKKVKRCNNAALNLLGYTKEELLKLEIFDLYADTDNGIKKAEEIFQQFLKDKKIQDEELQMKRKNGDIIWVSLTVNPVISDSGEIIESRSIIIDISERKKAEQKLKESEEKYRFLINNILDEVLEIELDGNITYVSPQVFDLLGFTQDEVIGTNAMSYAHPDDLTSVAEAIKRTVSSNEKVSVVFRLRHKNGHYVYVSTGGNYVTVDGKGKVIGVLRDITERKKVETALKLQRDQANLYKDIFAHDINNILQNIQSSLELCTLYLKNPEKSVTVKELYGIVKEQVSRGSKLISNVRKLSTLQGSNFRLNSIKVNNFLKQSIKFLRQSFQTRKIDIQCNYDKKDYFVIANELLLDVFENILLNAVRHNSNINVVIEIQISQEMVESKKLLKMQFIDNGDGIEDIRKEHIFQRGSKEKSSNGGMGLGLSLVKKTIDRYNGKIWVEDKVKGDCSKGSNFIILIPTIN
ncbi:MAG: PAS domain-containing sensor histidine kinase [Candidatus Lokiarchaeota archaeon]|nr:PAS domain-containing sensor histidine kinase [Candidatus Lokiarchaeota archaeon]